MATTSALTVKEFLAQKFPEGQRVELVEGEIVAMGSAGARHETVKANILRILIIHLDRSPIGRVFSETMFRLGELEARIPDVSLLLNEQVPAPLPEGLFEIGPALAVEVVSSESATDLEKKVQLYLEKGSRSVWVVYPEQRTVHVFDPSGAGRVLRGEQRLEVDWLPDFSVPVARFFDGL